MGLSVWTRSDRLMYFHNILEDVDPFLLFFCVCDNVSLRAQNENVLFTSLTTHSVPALIGGYVCEMPLQSAISNTNAVVISLPVAQRALYF